LQLCELSTIEVENGAYGHVTCKQIKVLWETLEAEHMKTWEGIRMRMGLDI
jgi:hypothetical protein